MSCLQVYQVAPTDNKPRRSEIIYLGGVSMELVTILDRSPELQLDEPYRFVYEQGHSDVTPADFLEENATKSFLDRFYHSGGPEMLPFPRHTQPYPFHSELPELGSSEQMAESFIGLERSRTPSRDMSVGSLSSEEIPLTELLRKRRSRTPSQGRTSRSPSQGRTSRGRSVELPIVTPPGEDEPQILTARPPAEDELDEGSDLHGNSTVELDDAA